MRVPHLRASVSLALSVALTSGPLATAQAQAYDEGVPRTVTGPDAEGGQFAQPQTYDAPSEGPRQPAEVWNPRPSGQFATDFCTDKARGMAMDTVAELPGGGVIKLADDVVLGPAQAAAQFEDPDGDEALPGQRVAAAVLALGMVGAQLVFPEIGLVVQGGQVMIGGTSYAIDSMMAAAREQQTMAMLTGDAEGFGRVGNLGADIAFVTFMRGIRRGSDYPYAGLSADNLGEYFHNPDEVTAWVGRWEAHVRNALVETTGRPDQQRAISNMLVPRLYNLWMAQRVAYVIEQANSALTPEVRARLAQAREQDDCAAQPQVAADQWRGLYSGIVDTPVPFEWDTRIRVFGIVCFGGTQTALYFDHFHLNGRFVGTDQREYYRVRNPAAASGAFCGEWETRREEIRR